MLRFVALWLCGCATAVAQGTPITVSIEPTTPWVETTRVGQALNFDLLVENSGRMALEITHFELTVRDAKGHMVAQQRIGQNGNTIEVIPVREVPAEGHLLLFNPFPMWPSDIELANVELALTLSDANGETTHVARQTTRPRAYRSKHTIHVPLDGSVFVHAGHDLHSHHRRFPLRSPMAEALKVRHNVTRYAYDLAVVDERGEMHKGDGTELSDWFGYGATVFAPAAGTVVEAHDGELDNEVGKPSRLDREALLRNPTLLFGNYVLIDHGDGEFGMLAHLKTNSVQVRVGQRVNAGQAVAAVGMSGDAALVHLHYQMQAAPGFSEGVPSRFAAFTRKRVGGWTLIEEGPIGTGEIVRDISRKSN
jgi:murein DD-endopeptidase MepM/ murein hydrolase activator NlpD